METVQKPDAHARLYEEYEERRAQALAMGGEKKLEARRARGISNARERIDRLVDTGSFIESGLFATSVFEADRSRTPADGKVVGYGKLDGREIAVIANDFTVLGASSSATNGKKIGQMKRVATQRGLPLVFLGESSGARMPDTMGSRGMGSMLGNDPTQYQRDAQGRDHGSVEPTLGLARNQRDDRSRGDWRVAAAFGSDRSDRHGGRHR